ncbi:clathrin light chain-domain-containing protein [Dipodascopsis tothii]|uniref:clathrin light chain-domain-containing protein n=1 Tax=Dipodascopsis tothii TaxID=44089 RepID=UPI0034CF206E
MSHFPSLDEIDQGQTDIHPAAGDAFEDAIGLGSGEPSPVGSAGSAGAAGDLLDDDFEGSAFPAIGEDDSISAPRSAPMSGAASMASAPSAAREDEPEVVKEWRARRELAIQRRDEQSEAKKAEIRQAAQQAVDDFYDNYNAKRDAALETTRAEAQAFLDGRENTAVGGTAWERIAKLVDLSEKSARTATTDKTRFRELLVSLRADAKAPGASGY